MEKFKKNSIENLRHESNRRKFYAALDTFWFVILCISICLFGCKCISEIKNTLVNPDVQISIETVQEN